ncbi:MAG: hypothetical protein IT292_05810 [Deltaproteobacteria bacterium]|nr:hypothetical protein [Deltaproteobacteria bacterium]
MIIGNDGYSAGPDSQKLRAYKQLFFYANPMKQQGSSYVQGQLPDAYIPLPLSASGELSFDESDNLITQDHTWRRIMIINYNNDSSYLVPTGHSSWPN